MSTSNEKLCLQWNEFKENISSAVGDLRHDNEFTDVTLACEDGQQVEAHKVVLVASSPFFLSILKKNKHPHPLIYMRGVRPENLMAMVDFFYHGEANVCQENLNSFLALAEELQLKGLRGNQTDREAEVSPRQAPKQKPKSAKYRSATPQFPMSIDAGLKNEIVQEESEKVVATTDQATNITDIASLDQQVKSMMTFSENAHPNKSYSGRARICKVCGKEGGMKNIMNHIEANHITGISVPCGLCGSVFTSRNLLSNHKSRKHKSQ